MDLPRFEVYPRQTRRGTNGGEETVPTGDYGWRFRDADREVTAVSGGSFTTREGAYKAIFDFAEVVGSPIIDIEG